MLDNVDFRALAYTLAENAGFWFPTLIAWVFIVKGGSFARGVCLTLWVPAAYFILIGMHDGIGNDDLPHIHIRLISTMFLGAIIGAALGSWMRKSPPQPQVIYVRDMQEPRSVGAE